MAFINRDLQTSASFFVIFAWLRQLFGNMNNGLILLFSTFYGPSHCGMTAHIMLRLSKKVVKSGVFAPHNKACGKVFENTAHVRESAVARK